MSAFAPNVDQTSQAGHRVERRPYPDGVAGVRLSLEQIARRIREGRLSDRVRGWAGDALIAAGRPQGVFAQAAAILSAIRAQTVYAADPVDAEYIASAEATLCLRPGLCIRAGDCDDLTVALGSALMSIGIPVRVIKQTFSAADQEHVLLEAQTESGEWIPLDPSTDYPCGVKAPASAEFRVDPMGPDFAGLAGADSQFVGIGAPCGVGRLPARRIAGAGVGRRASPRLPPRRVGQSCCASCADGVGIGQTATSSSGSSGSSQTGPTTVDTSAGGGGSNFGQSAASAFNQAQSDLESQIVTPIGTGDSDLTSSNYSGAVTAYQQAGTAGATVVGPEIDLAGAANVTQPLTQQAWQLNSSLAAISSSGATQSDAENAQQIANQMLSLYSQAIQNGQTALDQGSLGSVPTPGPGAIGFGTVLIGGLIAGTAGGLWWAHAKATHAPAVRRRR